MSFAITDSVTWVGKKDFGNCAPSTARSTPRRGSTYNSYLVREKTVLVDTVWGPYADEFLAGLDRRRRSWRASTPWWPPTPNPDHPAFPPPNLARLLKPDTPCGLHGQRRQVLSRPLPSGLNFRPVKTGDRLDLGGELIFAEALCPLAGHPFVT